MSYRSRNVLMLAMVAAGSLARAQGGPANWPLACFDPKNLTPISANYASNFVSNQLMMCTLGASGTFTYGGANGPCFYPTLGAVTVNAAGRIRRIRRAQNWMMDTRPLVRASLASCCVMR